MQRRLFRIYKCSKDLLNLQYSGQVVLCLCLCLTARNHRFDQHCNVRND